MLKMVQVIVLQKKNHVRRKGAHGMQSTKFVLTQKLKRHAEAQLTTHHPQRLQLQISALQAMLP
jgi:hypothetical protein